MRIRSCFGALALAATSSLAATPKLPGPAFPVFADAAAVETQCTRGLAVVDAKVKQVERLAPGSRWLAAYDGINALAEDVASPLYFVSNVHPDKAIREAAEACELRWQSFFTTLSQNETLYRAARRVKAADAIDREFLKQTLEGFEDAGIGLAPDKRARAKAILDRVTELVQAYEKNVREDPTKVAFDTAELQGVPERVWKDAKRDDQGRVLLGLDYPTVTPLLQGATSAATRERFWRAYNRQGGEANLKLLAEIGQLRREYAQLFGFASYADFTLRRRMAENPANVRRFLDDVRQAVVEREKRELEELREAKARDLGKPLADVKLDRWDVSYYTERVKRERYSVDQNAFRPYFPPQESLAFVMRLAEKMLGVKYTRVEGVKLWHPDAQAYVATDLKSGRALATLYVDPFPREGKYNHAAVWPMRSASARLARTPQASLVVNFDRQGLSLDEMETLLHEFGHAVHNNLSRARHSSQGGGTLRDFVEAPSQMLEEWVYDPKVLAVMREVCPACKPVPEDLLAKAKVAERYGKGVQYARQRLFASFDSAVYGADAPEPMALWRRLESETILGHVEGSMFPASFSHTANHYGAGYYSYLWSEVLAADLRTAFGSNKLDPVVGRRYRDTILANGSQKPPQQLVREFLGRPSNAQAFFEDLEAMIKSVLFALALAFAAPLYAQAPPAAKPRIEKAADLPRFTYKLDAKVEEVVRNKERFAPFAAQVRRDVESVIAGYDIPDKSTQRDLLGQLAALDFLDGQYDRAVERLEQIRGLQEKPADKLLSGLRLRAMARAAKAHGVGGEAYVKAVGETIAKEIAPLPREVVENSLKEAKAGAETMGEGRLIGFLREVVQPVVDANGSLSSEYAPALVNIRLTLTSSLPLKQTLVDTYSAWLNANKVVKADIWAARDVTLTARPGARPVVIAVWDSGTDTKLFGQRVVRGKDGKAATIAFDKYSRPAKGELIPISAAVRAKLPTMKARTKGFSDLQSNIDSPEAAEVKKFISSLTPEQYKAEIEELILMGNYEHGTHVAGIAMAGNPQARLLVARLEFGATLRPDPCPSREQSERDAKAYPAYVAFFKKHGARVVNMSWGGSVNAIEGDLEQCGIGKTPDERKKIAREYFEIGKKALTQAMASAPEILFVTAAGNSNQDASFVEDIPAGIVLPNLLTIGAVDLAGDEVSFTSYGPTVKAHANGYQVESYLPGGDRVALSGTSMASPQVANLAGKILAVNPKLKPAEVIKLIVETGEKTADGRRNLIHPKKALAAAGLK